MSTPSRDRQLFGTLLASTPAKGRSWKSLGIAIAIHAVLIILAIVTFKPFQTTPEREESNPLNIVIVEDNEIPDLPNPFAGQREIELADVAPPAPRREPEELIYTPGPLAPITIDPGPPAGAQPEAEAGGGVVGGTGQGKLSSRLIPRIDPRITSATAFPPAEKTGAEAVRERISDRLSVFNDSLMAAEEAERRATDWTVTDRNGNRWGFAPDGIYLGKVKLPAVAFSTPAGRRDEINGRIRDYNEIERQVLYEEQRASFKDRVELIRQRKDRERAEKKKQQEDNRPISESR